MVRGTPIHNRRNVQEWNTRWNRLMKITEIGKVASSPNPHHVDARKVYESPHAVAVVITLKSGESLKKHLTPVDVFFYVLEGTGVIEIGEERKTY